ncbi:hypothetical protein HYALB_00013146 [Hymenoscyphus albidus]|uniref:RNA-dependent RNA polymerase n=1 Tax=Hymenoscyphus albidus TaxID=595503 RepID=A0A9N9LQ12_9HELO|nr:hypothetical protein HYALB_00013146 [Hymenoscyphus albidus]
MPPAGESPRKRHARVQTVEEKNADECVELIKFIGFKRRHEEVIKNFNDNAMLLWSGWRHKPNADKDVIPRATRNREHPLTKGERKEMIELLLDHLRPCAAELKERMRTPKRARRPSVESSPFRDDPIPFPLSTPDSKRAREEPVYDAENSSKKSKYPEQRPFLLSKSNSNAMLPPAWRQTSFKGPGGYKSANTSFESTTDSIFSVDVNQYFGYPKLPDPKETVTDLGHEPSQNEKNLPIAASNQSSDYGAGSSFEAALNNAKDVNALILGTHLDMKHLEGSLSSQFDDIGIQNTEVLMDEDMLQERLEMVFPKLPPSLENAPVHVICEIAGVFCHVGVSMSEVDFPASSTLSDYATLWKFLKQLSALQGKTFPERSETAAWEAADTRYTCKGSGVVFGGSLKYNHLSETGPFYQLALKPMTLDRRHRLGRKLGDDRFLELDMPHLKGNGVPEIIQGERGQAIVMNWLVNGPHWLFGRSWKPFHCKPKKSKSRQEKNKDKKEKMSEVSLMYFFAVRGNGILPRGASRDEGAHQTIEIAQLLDRYVRITRKNEHQSYLKLFSRTSLALSRNTPTVVFDASQIRYKKDIEFAAENLIDGAGRISYAAALEVMKHLGLTYPAGGFQGRIGEAKEFWTVDHKSKSGDIWIEVYDSQAKWTRTRSKSSKNHDNHVDNRTLEVVHPSGPLKSADLNFQIFPILMDRAKNKDDMKKSLQKLLEVGLKSELDNLLTLVGDGPSLRKWVHETNPNEQQRLKVGMVKYDTGLPLLSSEKLIMLLDAGFETNKLQYAMDLSRGLFASKCNELKQRLNITVGKSTYAYMVPDFWGVLEEDEVYMDFSTFTDDVSGITGEMLHGRDLLVTRSPAHLPSDIQKVRAVAKFELMGLKDVIVFPTKGKPSLAQKLSGGDYDGDIAWICWEKSIVDNFVNAPVPPKPDFVKDGTITKDATTYRDLVEVCSEYARTSWKEQLCYNQGSVNTEEAIHVSYLLGDLVDQGKQGYSFGENEWKRLKTKLLDGKGIRMLEVEYKKEEPHLKPTAKHILDYLKWVAHDMVDTSLVEFERDLQLKDIATLDKDLVWHSEWAGEASMRYKEWRTILMHLNEDLKPIKESWVITWGKFQDKEDPDSEARSAINREHFEKYTAIVPHDETPFTNSIQFSYGSADLSFWALLKASVLFASFPEKHPRNFAWQMAGKQLRHIKALQNSDGAPHSVVPLMYSIYKRNNGMIKKLQTQNLNSGLTENVGVGNMDEFEELADDA